MQPAQLWQLGDYAAVGDRWGAAGAGLAARLVRPGDRVLDVACGPGQAAIAAALAGGEVTGLDVAPSLLAAAAAKAELAGVTLRLVEADMTSIPEPDESFDVVLSAFGAMFATDPAAMAAELVRVCAVGGTVGVLAWLPGSAFVQLRPLYAEYLPPGQTGPAIETWAEPDLVRAHFAGQPVTVRTEEASVDVCWPSLDVAVEQITELVPGSVATRTALEPTGVWPEVRDRVRALFASVGHERGGEFVLPAGYLITLAERTGQAAT